MNITFPLYVIVICAVHKAELVLHVLSSRLSVAFGGVTQPLLLASSGLMEFGNIQTPHTCAPLTGSLFSRARIKPCR